MILLNKKARLEWSSGTYIIHKILQLPTEIKKKKNSNAF